MEIEDIECQSANLFDIARVAEETRQPKKILTHKLATYLAQQADFVIESIRECREFSPLQDNQKKMIQIT